MLLAVLHCGGCGHRFTANVRTVPNWRGAPACESCWDRTNALRIQLGMQPWDTPADAYPPPAPAKGAR